MKPRNGRWPAFFKTAVPAFLTAFAGINLASSGHIAVAWINPYWPEAAWMIVMIVGVAFAIVQTRLAATASRTVPGPNAEIVLVARAVNPTFAFGVRLAWTILAALMLGALTPLLWETVIVPAIFIVSLVQEQTELSSTIALIDPEKKDVVLLPLAGLTIAAVVLLVSRANRASRRKWSKLAVTLSMLGILVGWIWTAFSLWNYSPGVARTPHNRENSVYQNALTRLETAEQKISDLVARSDLDDARKSDWFSRAERFRDETHDWDEKLQRPLIEDGASSVTLHLTGDWQQQLAAVALNTWGALLVAYWVFFSFFALGQSANQVVAAGERYRAIWRGGVAAILIAFGLLVLGELSLVRVLHPQFSETAWLHFNVGNLVIPPNSLNLFGLLYPNRTGEYLFLVFVWCLALLSLFATFWLFVAENLEDALATIIVRDRFKIHFTVALALIAIVGSYLSIRFGLFEAQIGVFAITAIVQAVIVLFAVRQIASTENRRRRTAVVAWSIFYAAILLLGLWGLFGVGNAAVQNHELRLASLAELRAIALFAGILAVVIVFAGCGVYWLRKRRFQRVPGLDLDHTYRSSSAKQASNSTHRFLLVNGLLGSRECLLRALRTGAALNVQSLFFFGPLHARNLIVYEQTDTDRYARHTGSLSSWRESAVVESTRVSLSELHRERTEAAALDRYSLSCDSPTLSRLTETKHSWERFLESLAQEEASFWDRSCNVELEGRSIEAWFIETSFEFAPLTSQSKPILGRRYLPPVHTEELVFGGHTTALSWSLNNQARDDNDLEIRVTRRESCTFLHVAEATSPNNKGYSMRVPRSTAASGGFRGLLIAVSAEGKASGQLIVR